VRFSIGAFAGRPAEREQWRRLLWALAGSLLLHWGVWAVLRPGSGAVGPGPAKSAVFVTLRGIARAAPALVIEAPVDATPAAAPDAPSVRVGEPRLALSHESTDSADAAPLLATLGQRRLEAQLPPYLLAPSSDAAQGPWYFRRSELTVAPKLLDEPLIPQPEKPGAAGQPTGKVVLRVFVGAGGTVDRVEVATSSAPAAFDEAASAAFSHVRLLQFARQGEGHVFLGAVELGDFRAVASRQAIDDVLHQDFRCRGAGGDADAAGAAEPGGVDLFGLVDQVGAAADQFGDFAQAIRVGTRPAADDEHDFAVRASCLTASCRFCVA
jgi:TonB family protein